MVKKPRESGALDPYLGVRSTHDLREPIFEKHIPGDDLKGIHDLRDGSYILKAIETLAGIPVWCLHRTNDIASV